MIQYYTTLPLKLFFSLITLFWAPFGKKVNDDNTDQLVNCSSFNKFYYIASGIDFDDQYFQSIKNSFLQKEWGVTRYSDGMVKEMADSRDIIYASLGALKDIELNRGLHEYELAIYGIIDNNLALKHFNTGNYDVSTPFGPEVSVNPSQAMAIICALTILSRRGDQNASKILKELMWKRGYSLFLLFPDLINLEETIVGYCILAKCYKGYAQGFIQTLALFYSLITCHRFSDSMKILLRRCL